MPWQNKIIECVKLVRDGSFMRHLFDFWCLTVCLFMSISTATAQGLPDLMPVVVDANKGYIEVRNVGNAVAEPSQVYVVCSIRVSGNTSPCAAGLHLPGYIEKWNVLPFEIPALQPGSKFPLHLFGSASFPRQDAISYGMKISTDPLKHIAESNETNNYTRLDTVTHETGQGLLQLGVLMDGKPVQASIKVTRPGNPNKVVLQTESIPGATGKQMKQTPFEVSLPVGKYDLYVHAELVSPLKIDMRTKPLPIVIKKDERLDKTLTIPTGRIQLSTTVVGKETKGIKIEMAGFNDGFQYFSSRGYLETPLDVTVPAGTYKLNAWNTEEKQTRTESVEIKAGSVITKSIDFDKLHAGYLKLNLVMGGKPIPFEFGWTSPATDFVSDEYLSSSETGESVVPLAGGHNGQPMMLRVGGYDLKVHERAVGGKDIVLKGIAVREGETVEKTVEISQPGALNIMARWTHQPLNLAACAEYHNPINLNRLGALMGGGSGAGGRSRGDCFSPIVSLAASVSSPGRSDGNIDKETYPKRAAAKNDHGQFSAGDSIEIIEIEPGVYDVTVWPVGHPELDQTLKDVAITAGGDVQRELEFRWPDQKK